MNPRWLFPPLLGLAAFAAGWLMDGSTDAPQNGSAKGSPAGADARGSAPRHGPPFGADDTPPSKILAFRQAMLAPAGLSRTCALADALDALALEDFPAVLALAVREPDEVAWKLIQEVFQRWTRLDPKSAGEAARLTPGSLRDAAIASVTYEWARADAPAATAWVRTLTPRDRGSAGTALIGIRMEDWDRDPAATIRAALALPGELLGDSRRRACSSICENVFSTWAARDPQAAIAFIASISDPAIRKEALQNSARGWADHDMPGSLAWLRGLTDEKVRDQVEPEILQSLARKNPRAAADFARSLAEGPRRDLALSNVVCGLDSGKEDDAKLIATIVPEIPLDAGNHQLFSAYLNWMRTDVAAAMSDFFTKLGRHPMEGEEREQIEQMIHTTLGFRREGSDAAALAKIPDGPENALRDRMLVDASYGMGATDSAKAQAWVKALPPGTAREAAFQGITQGWASSAANAAAEWLQTLPAGPDRTGAITGFVGATFDQDPAGALTWVQTIPDAADRERALDTAWRAWAGRARASAEQWRDTAPELSAAQRSRLK